MIVPSLTPHTDAVKQAVEQMRAQMAPGMAGADDMAALMRITVALSSAAALSLAHEGDMRQARRVMFDGILNAAVNVIVQSSMTLFDEGDAPAAMLAMARKVLQAVDDTARGVRFAGPAVAVAVEKMGEA